MNVHDITKITKVYTFHNFIHDRDVKNTSLQQREFFVVYFKDKDIVVSAAWDSKKPIMSCSDQNIF